MLARVVENVYWLARYLERAENTARLVSVNTNLLLDLPKGLAPGWQPLVDITGIRLQKATLVQILSALKMPIFPDRGIVIGIVLDKFGAPLPNIAVVPSAGDLEYPAPIARARARWA